MKNLLGHRKGFLERQRPGVFARLCIEPTFLDEYSENS
jgi:hypothetical protein